mmetsp:Transcript_47570/g.146795  ORF Transcript_47570/g.146795 Transcript_47570/m.146795 type:complete len:334 (+) Transcript_47570:538-1539(+)
MFSRLRRRRASILSRNFERTFLTAPSHSSSEMVPDLLSSSSLNHIFASCSDRFKCIFSSATVNSSYDSDPELFASSSWKICLAMISSRSLGEMSLTFFCDSERIEFIVLSTELNWFIFSSRTSTPAYVRISGMVSKSPCDSDTSRPIFSWSCADSAFSALALASVCIWVSADDDTQCESSAIARSGPLAPPWCASLMSLLASLALFRYSRTCSSDFSSHCAARRMTSCSLAVSTAFIRSRSARERALRLSSSLGFSSSFFLASSSSASHSSRFLCTCFKFSSIVLKLRCAESRMSIDAMSTSMTRSITLGSFGDCVPMVMIACATTSKKSHAS